MSYRDDREELKQRVDVLEKDLESTRLRAEQAEGAQAKAERLAVELAGAQRNLERIQGELLKLQGPPKKSNTGAFLVVGVAVGIVFLAGAAILVLGVRSAPRSPSISLPMTAIEPVPVPPMVAPPPEAEPVPTAFAVRAKTVRWTGKVLSSSGFALPAGTPCFAEAALKSKPNLSIGIDELLIQCADKKLYRLSDPLNGMSFTSSNVFEEPGPEAGSYSYSIAFQDQGQRDGKRAQVSLESAWGKTVVWNDAGAVYKVAIQLNSESVPNREPPLIETHEQAEVDFRRRIELKGAVAEVRGQTTVQNGQACALKVFPMWGEGGHNCRVSLRCGEQVLYGSGNSGHNRCELKEGSLLSVRDERASKADGDPILLLDTVASTALVQESGDDGFDIHIRMDKPKHVAK